MNFNEDEGLELKGDLIFELYDPKTDETKIIRVKNLITDVGRQLIASRLANDGDNAQGKITHMDLGEGTTQAVTGDTVLETPHTNSRTEIDSATVNEKTVSYVCQFDTNVAVGNISEAGLFNGAGNDAKMFSRSVFPTFNKSNKILTLTWNITV